MANFTRASRSTSARTARSAPRSRRTPPRMQTTPNRSRGCRHAWTNTRKILNAQYSALEQTMSSLKSQGNSLSAMLFERIIGDQHRVICSRTVPLEPGQHRVSSADHRPVLRWGPEVHQTRREALVNKDIPGKGVALSRARRDQRAAHQPRHGARARAVRRARPPLSVRARSHHRSEHEVRDQAARCRHQDRGAAAGRVGRGRRGAYRGVVRRAPVRSSSPVKLANECGAPASRAARAACLARAPRGTRDAHGHGRGARRPHPGACGSGQEHTLGR